MIDSFKGEYAFLSNFQRCRVQFEGEEYISTEHAYQAAKTLIPEERETVRLCGTPGQAKGLGNKCTLRPDWEEVKLGVMRDLLVQKFAYPDLRAKLEATGNQELVEGNYWNDTYWGVCKGVGTNWLGRLLMEIRDDNRME